MKNYFPARFLIVLLLIWITSGLQILGQTDTLIRPKIGLVLSGGGAKGLAHIGVLKVLEEAGIQPDYITGTSMGSIIGGLYAIGYNAEQLSELNKSIHWTAVLTDEISVRNIATEEKYDYKRFALELPFVNGKVSLPSGLIEGQKLSQLFSKLTWSAAGIKNFDDFPVPFRCLGTDIIQGKRVIFSDGDLALAMRSSMAIPSVFTPVLLDSTMLIVDGGVLRNFPVDDVIEMGADIVIGVKVGFTEKITLDKLYSIPEILARTASFYGELDSYEQQKKVDILIEPELSEYSTSSFNNGKEIEIKGEEAARKQFDRLKQLSDSLNSLNSHKPRRKLPQNDSIFIVDIEVENVVHTKKEFIIRKSGLVPETWITPQLVNKAIDKVYGTLNYDKITYSFRPSEGGYILVFSVKEKPQTYVKGSLHYDNYYDAGIILNFTKKNLFLQGTRFSSTLDISKYPRFKFYYHKYMGPRQQIVSSLFLLTERNKLPIYLNGGSVGFYTQSYLNIGVDSRYSIDICRQLGMSFTYEVSTVKPNQSAKELYPEIDFNEYGFGALGANFFFNVNTLDNLSYPSKGVKIDMSLKRNFGSEIFIKRENSDSSNYSNLDLDPKPSWKFFFDAEQYVPITNTVSVNAGWTLGLTSPDIILTDYYFIGGYRFNLRQNHIPFVGLGLNEVSINNFLKLKAGLDYQVITNLYITSIVNGVAGGDSPEQLYKGITKWTDGSHYFGYGLGITAKTLLGPVSFIVGSNTTDSKLRWYVNLGFTF
ncbi:MAG: patatin-like phospholipase family protein [Bacteroidales bacterium]|nr:patatin-like phospholipase family protein [Bacteroidales bacterium]